MIPFEILIEDVFFNISLNNSLDPMDNKTVLSLLNDFENGEWRYDKFQRFIWNNIKETALSHKERQALLNDGEDSVLTEAAKSLRIAEDNGKGSEISEILLYGIMKHHYKALPVVPKIFYKQNSQDNAKGSDSVHIVIENDDTFSLWLGEAKFYNDITNAQLQKIVESVKDSLQLHKLKKENYIITNVSDLNDLKLSDEIRQKIFKYLSTDTSIDLLKPILHIPILLLYECAITKNETHFTEEYKKQISSLHKERSTKYFEEQIKSCSDIDLYSEIKFHIILFPVPEKENIVNKFIQKANVYRL